MAVTTSEETDDDVSYFVVRRPGEWILAPIPATDPTPITVDDVLARLRSGLGTFEPRTGVPAGLSLPECGADDTVAPVWMFVGLAAAGFFVVGAPNGDEVLLDETDVRLLDALYDSSTPAVLVASGAFHDVTDLQARCARLVAAGCARITARGTGDPASPPAPVVEHEPVTVEADPAAAGGSGAVAPPAGVSSAPSGVALLRARVSDAYRLSSKLRPIRDAVDRVRGPKS